MFPGKVDGGFEMIDGTENIFIAMVFFNYFLNGKRTVYRIREALNEKQRDMITYK